MKILLLPHFRFYKKCMKIFVVPKLWVIELTIDYVIFAKSASDV